MEAFYIRFRARGEISRGTVIPVGVIQCGQPDAPPSLQEETLGGWVEEGHCGGDAVPRMPREREGILCCGVRKLRETSACLL